AHLPDAHRLIVEIQRKLFIRDILKIQFDLHSQTRGAASPGVDADAQAIDRLGPRRAGGGPSCLFVACGQGGRMNGGHPRVDPGGPAAVAAFSARSADSGITTAAPIVMTRTTSRPLARPRLLPLSRIVRSRRSSLPARAIASAPCAANIDASSPELISRMCR